MALATIFKRLFMKRMKKSVLITLIALLISGNSCYASNFEYGISALKRNDLGSALQYFSSSLKEDKNDPYRLYFLGVTLEKMGDKNRASKAYQAALTLNPSPELKQNILRHQSNIKPPQTKMTTLAGLQSKVLRNRHFTPNKPNYLDKVTLNGQVKRWSVDKMPIKVHINRAYEINEFDPRYISQVKRAFQTWQSSMDNRIRFIFVPNPTDADILVQWQDQFSSHGVVGQNPFSSVGTSIIKSDVILALQDGNGGTLEPENIYAITLHEVGHALGLQGHSDDANDIMYFMYSYSNYHGTLTERDITTMKLLYNLEADVSNDLPISMSSAKEFYKLLEEGQTYVQQGNYQQGLKTLIAAEQLYDKEAFLHFNKGVCYVNLSNYLEAIKSFNVANSLSPDETFTLYNLAISQINHAITLPEIIQNIQHKRNYFKQALYNLNKIENKPDKPQNTNELINNLKTMLNT